MYLLFSLTLSTPNVESLWSVIRFYLHTSISFHHFFKSKQELIHFFKSKKNHNETLVWSIIIIQILYFMYAFLSIFITLKFCCITIIPNIILVLHLNRFNTSFLIEQLLHRYVLFLIILLVDVILLTSSSFKGILCMF